MAYQAMATKMKIVKFLVWLLFCCVLINVPETSLYAYAVEKSGNKIVAIIDDTAITTHDVGQKFQFLMMVNHITPQNTDAVTQLKQEALQMLIDQIIIEKEAVKFGISVSDSDIQNALQKLADQNHLTLQQFEHLISTNNVSVDSLKSNIKKELLFNEIIKLQIKPGVAVRKVEIEENLFQFLRAKASSQQENANIADVSQVSEVGERFSPSTEVKLAQIVLPLNLDKTELQNILQIIFNDLTMGKDFGALAVQYSHNVESARHKGVIGWLSIKNMSPQSVNAISKLLPGGVSDPIEIGNNLVIFKVLEFKNLPKPSQQNSTNTDKIAQSTLQDDKIDEQLQVILSNAKLQLKLSEYLEKIRRSHLVRVL
ncbi:Parvulin-like PPIase (modular protein) [Alphaproteobacteria bacterium]